MRQELQQMMEKIYRQYVKRKRWHKVVMALAAVVVFCTTYALVLPAITAETNCGIEEHTHEAVCYANEDIEGLLICVLEEHTHVESCYQKEVSEDISAINEESIVEEIVEEEIVEEEIVEEEIVEEEIVEEEIVEEEIVEEEIVEEEIVEEEVVEEEVVEEEIIEEEIVEEEVVEEEVVEEEIIEEEIVDEEIVEDEIIDEEIVDEETGEEEEEEDEEVPEDTETETLVTNGVITTDEGDEIVWELIPNDDESYTLKVSGNGVIPDDFVRNVPELVTAAESVVIRDLIIDKDILSIGQYSFSEMASLESVVFEEANALTWLGKGAFSNSLNNIKQFAYTANTFPALTEVDTDVFEGNKFEELTIGSLPFNNGLFGKSSDLKVVTFETKFDQTYDLFAESSARFKAVISAEVDEFYAANLKSIRPYTSSLHFEGPNYLTISSENGEETGFPEPLNDLSGNYYADEEGVLYQLNDDDTAILLYCPPGLETYEALTQIPKEDENGNYTVSAIDEHACALATDLLSFSEKITNPEDTSEVKSDKNTIKFLASSLNSETVTKESLSYNNGGLVITTSDEGSLEGTDGFIYYTGIVNQTTVNISTGEIDDVANKVFRLYMIASDLGLEFDAKTQADGKTVKIDDKITYTRNKLGDGKYYYIDLPVLVDGNTISIDLKFKYPSPTTPGGKVYLWGAILDKVAAQNEAAQFESAKKVDLTTGAYHKMTWITSEDQFDVEKTAGSSARLKPSKDGKAVVSDLCFVLKVTRADATTQVQNKGENFVANFDFVDTMTLPEEFSWREGVVEAIKAYTCENNKIIVTLGGKKYRLAEYLLDDDDFAIETKSVAIGNNGELQIHFIVKNMKIDSYGNITEADVPEIQLNIGNDILIADLTNLVDKDAVKVNNNVTMHPNYTFPKTSENVEDSAEAEVSIGEGAVSLTKTHDRISGQVCWGENVNYTVTMKNESVFQAPSYDKLVDTLSEYTYISAENLQNMFNEDKITKKLSVQITNATLYQISEKRTAVDVNGDPVNSLTPQNTGVNVVYNGLFDRLDTEHMNSNGKATIIFQWSGESEEKNLTMLVYDSENNRNEEFIIGSVEYPTIKAALDSIGYTITSQAASQYICTWDVTGVSLSPGESKEYKIPATIKNTFMLLGRDLTGYHHQFYGVCEIINNAVLQDTDENVIDQVATESKTASYELFLGKTASSGGKQLRSGFDVSEGAVLDYSLNINHHGKSKYDVLPVVDHMQGGNVLLAKVSENETAEWVIKDNKGETVSPVSVKIGEDEEPYYVLTEGTYNKVKFGEYLASDVIVEKTDKGLDTIIHWYFTDTPDNAYTERISYKALVSRAYTGITSTNFSINNEAWLNDHQSHRLYASLFGTGSMLVADKKIVTESGKKEVYSLIDTTNSKVTYELTLENIGLTELSITGSKMYDALPNTFGSFEWTKGSNVNILYSHNEYITNGDEWTIKDKSPANGTKTTGQYYICWNDSFKATVPAGQTLTITVKLDFPNGDGWGEFFKACNGNLLVNSFYVYHMSAQVSHNLRGSSSAKLQKGVYDVGTMSYSNSLPEHTNKRGEPYVSTGTRHIYSNLSSRSDIITFYVCIFNDGTNPLYLNDIIDTLPKGSRPLSLCSIADIGKPNGIGNLDIMKDTSANNNTLRCMTEPPNNDSVSKLSSIESGDIPIKYLNTEVKAVLMSQQINGHYRMRLTFSGGDLAQGHYDHIKQKYYLQPNEAIRFGYSINTPFASATEDDFVNTIMMPYTDIGGDLKISDLEVKASDLNGLNPNDGDCEVITDAQALVYGNERDDNDTHDQWLASEVSLTKGMMLPGIRKTALKSGGSNESDEFNASDEDPLNWEIYVYNDGTAELNDYIISDEIEWPYRFLGDVTYEVYARAGEGSEPAVKAGTKSYNKLFSIVTNTMDKDGSGDVILECYDPDANKMIPYLLNKKDNNFTAEIRCACLVRFEGEDVLNPLAIKVSFEMTETGNQRMNIQFLGHTSPSTVFPNATLYRLYWGLLASGYGKLTLSAENKTGEKINKPYDNYAWLTPVGLTANRADEVFSQTPVHGNFTSIDIMGEPYNSVVSNATINVSSGFFTSAKKSVTEINDTINNTATSTDAPKNYIVLGDKSSTFRYDLEVTTPAEVAPTKFVLIDSLPEVGDLKAFSSTALRYSEFNVSFKEDSIVSVKVIDNEKETILTSDQYRIDYSTATTFTSEDWDGTRLWSTDLTLFKENGKLTARSIRLIITDQNALKKNSKIILSFDAVIDDADISPNQIAWNSFGYQYEVIKEPGNEPEVFKAAPSKVGIKFPTAPKLLKELHDQKGNSYNADKNETFKFLIYQGDRLSDLENVSFSDGMIEELRNIMRSNEVSQYFLQDVNVLAGHSSSDSYVLTPNMWYLLENNEWIDKSAETHRWKWVDGANYTVVELPNESMEYELDLFKNDKNRTSSTGSFTFTYRADEEDSETKLITAINKYRTWELILSKADSNDQSNLLPGAVFALYSPNSADAGLYNADEEITALKNQLGISDAEIQTVKQVGNRTYYLKDIIRIGSTGRHSWNELKEEIYVLQELRAPNGYNLDDALHVILREQDSHVEYTVTNEAGYVLPESGGIGISGLTIGGAALMLTATAGALVNKITSKKRKKGGEQ